MWFFLLPRRTISVDSIDSWVLDALAGMLGVERLLSTWSNRQRCYVCAGMRWHVLAFSAVENCRVAIVSDLLLDPFDIRFLVQAKVIRINQWQHDRQQSHTHKHEQTSTMCKYTDKKSENHCNNEKTIVELDVNRSTDQKRNSRHTARTRTLSNASLLRLSSLCRLVWNRGQVLLIESNINWFVCVCVARTFLSHSVSPSTARHMLHNWHALEVKWIN